MCRAKGLVLALFFLVFLSFATEQQKEVSPEEKIIALEKKVAALEKQVGLLEKKISEQVMSLEKKIAEQVKLLEKKTAELEKKLSELEKRLPPAMTVKPTPAPKVIPTEKPSFYIGNARTKKFHRPECEWAQKIAPYNRVTLKSREKAIKQSMSLVDVDLNSQFRDI